MLFESVDRRRQTTYDDDDGPLPILYAPPGAFGSDELKTQIYNVHQYFNKSKLQNTDNILSNNRNLTVVNLSVFLEHQ